MQASPLSKGASAPMYLPVYKFRVTSPNEEKFFSEENIERVSTPNPRPDPTGLREVIINNRPCPTKNHTKFDFLFELIRMGYIVIMGALPLCPDQPCYPHRCAYQPAHRCVWHFQAHTLACFDPHRAHPAT